MAGAGNVKTKQKRTKLTLDRLLSIKKYITDSLSVLAKHDKASSQIERNNTVPKGTGKTVYKKVNDSGKCGNSGAYTPRTTAHADQCADLTRNPQCYLQEISYAPNAQSVIQRIQTWPHDEYSTHQLEDQCTNQNQNRFHLQDFERPRLETVASHCQSQGPMGQNNSTQTHTTPSVKHQAIQTDMNDEFDINADIIRYLSQFNDKIAFSLCAPTVFRKSGNGYPYYYEQDYCLYSNAHNYTPRRPARLSPRRPEEHIQLPTSDYYAQDMIYRPLYDPSPSLAYHEPTRQYGFGISSDRREKQEFEKGVPNTSDFAWTKNNNYMAPSRVDTRVSSEDSGSILSSEADSDFMFYPCTSLTQNLQRMTMIDSRSGNFLSPPSDLPENVSTHFSWRAGFYGSSLDEVTLQFFLDEDALSDDVFLDENELMSPADNNDTHGDNEAALESASMYSRLYDICPQSYQDCVSSPGDDTGFRDSYGDNCYLYRYADIDEVFNNYNSIDQPSEIDETSARALSPEPAESRCIPASNSSDTHSNLPDCHLEFSDEFSHVLDSLRRNSTQTKARKMWRQRRAKAKKNSKLNSDNNSREQLNNPECQPAFFTFDHMNMLNHNANFPPKPLRGILKKKERTSSEQSESGSNQQAGDTHSSVDSIAECPTMFTLDLNSRPLPGSPCVYASVHKRFNHTSKLPSVDEVAEVTTESAFDQTRDQSHLETDSAGNEPTGPSHQLSNDDTNPMPASARMREPEDQQKSPLGSYNTEDQQKSPLGSYNTEDQQKSPLGSYNTEDQQKSPLGSYNTEDQQKSPLGSYNTEDQQKSPLGSYNTEDQQKSPLGSYNTEDQQKSPLGSYNTEDQQKSPLGSYNTEDQQKSPLGSYNTEDQQKSPLGSYNTEDQQKSPLGSYNTEDQQKSPLGSYNSDEFHVILSSDPDGQRKIIALRKNSIEAYEWTRSLQRRHRKKVRRAKWCHSCPKSNECQIALHQNGLTSSI